jgi:serine/threonine protein kinase
VRCGTPGYVAPEIVNIKDLKAKCDPICDIFSLGVISHILLTGKSPFPGKTYNEVLAQNRACNLNFDGDDCSKLPNISTKYANPALDLVKRMLDRSPKTRITASEALKHPFFSSEVKLLPRISNKEE